MPTTAGRDPYADAKTLGIFEQIPKHDFQDVDASTIVARIMDRKEMFVERQRRKEGKATVEAEVKRKEAEG
jgi:ethanolamine-phosphate cytidylyltransferase